jgi:hypothetical protein
MKRWMAPRVRRLLCLWSPRGGAIRGERRGHRHQRDPSDGRRLDRALQVAAWRARIYPTGDSRIAGPMAKRDSQPPSVSPWHGHPTGRLRFLVVCDGGKKNVAATTASLFGSPGGALSGGRLENRHNQGETSASSPRMTRWRQRQASRPAPSRRPNLGPAARWLWRFCDRRDDSRSFQLCKGRSNL